MTEEERQRIVNAGIDKLKIKKQLSRHDELEKLFDQVRQITNEVRAIVQPVLAAGARKDEQALRTLLAQLYVERFAKLSKDELEVICTVLHVEIAMENIMGFGQEPSLVT